MPPPEITVEELDVRIAEVESMTAGIAATLYRLEEERELRSPSAALLAGASAQIWSEAVAQIAVLWQWFAQVSEAVQALRARRGHSRLRHSTLVSLAGELDLPVIHLAGTAVFGSSLSAHDGPVSVPNALGILRLAYEQPATTIASLIASEDVVGARVTDLQRQLAELDDPDPTTSGPLRDRREALAGRLDMIGLTLAADPLSVDLDEVSRVAEDLASFTADLDAAAQAAAALGPLLDALAAQLDGLAAEIARVRPTVEAAELKIYRSSSALMCLDELGAAAESLCGELSRLGDHPGPDCAGGLRDLGARAGHIGQRVSDLGVEASAGLERRRELRGLLDAYLGKVRAIGRAEDPVLEDSYSSARAVLYSAPCDLERAERWVSAYGRLTAGYQLQDRQL